MREIDEERLEQVSGGADAGGDFDEKEWYRQNCLNCANNGAVCGTKKKMAAASDAKNKAKQGKNCDCPHKR